MYLMMVYLYLMIVLPSQLYSANIATNADSLWGWPGHTENTVIIESQIDRIFTELKYYVGYFPY